MFERNNLTEKVCFATQLGWLHGFGPEASRMSLWREHDQTELCTSWQLVAERRAGSIQGKLPQWLPSSHWPHLLLDYSAWSHWWRGQPHDAVCLWHTSDKTQHSVIEDLLQNWEFKPQPVSLRTVSLLSLPESQLEWMVGTCSSPWVTEGTRHIIQEN